MARAQRRYPPHARLEERALNASGALQTLVCDGWRLDYRPGPTKPRCCLKAFDASTLPLEEKVAFCAAFYAAAGLPALFRLLPFCSPARLDGWLDHNGSMPSDNAPAQVAVPRLRLFALRTSTGIVPARASSISPEPIMRSADEIYALAAAVGQAALSRRVRIATAESCTGGLVAAAITSVAGSSDWFDRGLVVYSNAAKVDALNVPPATLERFGAVSTQTALAMAQGALRHSEAQWSVAITGIAGPGGGSPDKPVGTVCFAWAGPGRTEALRTRLEGDRAAVREASVQIALQGLLERLAQA